MTPRITVAIVLAALLMPWLASAQQVTVADFGPERGMVREGDGEWWAPSPAYALEALADGILSSNDWRIMADDILRRVHGAWPEEELAAFANALADAIVAEQLDQPQDGRAGIDLSLVLSGAAKTAEGSRMTMMVIGSDPLLADQPDPGTPSVAALSAMIRVYEELEAAWRRDEVFYFPSVHLASVLLAEPRGRGGAYVRAVFDAAEPPPPGLTIEGKRTPETAKHVWCQVGEYLYGDLNRNRWSPAALAEFGTPPLLTDSEAEEYAKLCGTGSTFVIIG